MEPFIVARDLHYSYAMSAMQSIEALRGIDLEIHYGEFVAILGHNGSGKSTLARCLNGLLLPTQGDVWVAGRNTRDPTANVAIRASVGMVFQNPENQFVATTVEEEVAFGPENLGLPQEELLERVRDALEAVNLSHLAERNPHNLSAGQQARLAIADVLAMKPQCIILDEATAMLDPLARRDLVELIQELHRNGLTVIHVTHNMTEAAKADRVLVLDRGRLALDGEPGAVFYDPRVRELGLSLPLATTVAQGLRQRGVSLPKGIISAPQLVRALGKEGR